MATQSKIQSRKITAFFFILSAVILFLLCSKSPTGNPGIYINKDPKFTIEYPKAWIPGPKFRGSRLSVMAPDGSHGLTVWIFTFYKDFILVNFPENWIADMKKSYPRMSNYQILFKKIATLNDGTKAVRAKISCISEDGKSSIIFSLLAAHKNDKVVGINSYTAKEIPFEIIDGPLDSLRFDK